MYRNNRNSLFSDVDLRSVIEDRRGKLEAEIGSIDQNRLLNTSEEDLVTYLIAKYELSAPELDRDSMTAEQQETQIDVSHHPNRWIDDRSRPFYIPGQQIDIDIPFKGDGELFRAKPSTFTLSGTPSGRVVGQSLILTVQVTHDSNSDIKPLIERQIQEVSNHLDWVRNDVATFNNQIRTIAVSTISARKQRLLQNQGRLASLGIPLKVRADSPRTYTSPEIKRKIAPVLPKASTAPFEPEPAMSIEHYEHVLTVVQNMTQVMERSPSTFATMGEEALRDHYLVQLNGQFEGQATGETFNAAGKTDILLRISGKNVFIGECKFWKGAKGYSETIDQLLSYQSWRDTKAAILVFNRNRDTSKVLEEVKATTEAHPNYKRTLNWKHESGFRFVMHHPSDANRELTMTVLVFDIPQAASKKTAANKSTKQSS